MEGYVKLSSLMGAYPEVAIFRRFRALNAQNLVYLQAELVALEKDLRVCATEDEASGNLERARYSKDWFTLSQSTNGNSSDESSGKQWKLILTIRQKLMEYSKSLNTEDLQLNSLHLKTKPSSTKMLLPAFRNPTHVT